MTIQEVKTEPFLKFLFPNKNKNVVPWDGWIGTGMYGSPGASKSILAQPQGIILLDLVTPEGEKRRCFQKSSIAKICLSQEYSQNSEETTCM